MEIIVLTIALVLTNLIWMFFYLVTRPEKEAKMVIKRIEPFVKKITKKDEGEKEETSDENPFVGMEELSEAPLADVLKSAKLN